MKCCIAATVFWGLAAFTISDVYYRSKRKTEEDDVEASLTEPLIMKPGELPWMEPTETMAEPTSDPAREPTELLAQSSDPRQPLVSEPTEDIQASLMEPLMEQGD